MSNGAADAEGAATRAGTGSKAGSLPEEPVRSNPYDDVHEPERMQANGAPPPEDLGYGRAPEPEREVPPPPPPRPPEPSAPPSEHIEPTASNGAPAAVGNTGNAAAVAGDGAAEPLLLGCTPTTDTLAQIRGMSQPQAWQAGEQYVQELAGSPGQAHFDIPGGPFGDSTITGSGGRFVDAPVTAADGSTIANEVKTYKQWTTVNGSPVQQTVPLSPQIQQQVLKDSWPAGGARHFSPRSSPVDTKFTCVSETGNSTLSSEIDT